MSIMLVSRFPVMLEEKLKAAGVEVVLICPGRTDKRYDNAAQFLIGRLCE